MHERTEADLNGLVNGIMDDPDTFRKELWTVSKKEIVKLLLDKFVRFNPNPRGF